MRDLLRRRMLVVQHRTGVILSLQNMAARQTGQKIGWRALRKLNAEERTELLADHDCLAFVEAVHHALRTCPQAQSFYEKKRAKRNGALATDLCVAVKFFGSERVFSYLTGTLYG